jgi:N-acetylneuraminic acid mutarotase
MLQIARNAAVISPRGRWLLRNLGIAALLLVLWDTVLIRPLRVLVVLLHEIFHALAALATGGGVNTIEVISHRTGLTSLYGGVPAIVYSAGYAGTAFFGAVLLGSTYRWPVKRSLYLGIGVLLLANTLLFVRNPFGWMYGLVAGLFFITLFFVEFPFSAYVMDLIGVLCVVDVFYDITGFYLAYSRNDAAILSRIVGLPYYVVLSIWTVAAAVMVGAAVAVTWNNLTPQKLEAKLHWGEFRFVTRRFVERNQGMRFFESRGEHRRGRSTIAVYLSVLAALLLLTVWVSRFVLFQPWTAREWVNAASARGEVYFFGGRDRHGQNYDEVYRVDLQNLRLDEIATLPSPRFGMSAVSIGDRVFLLGGFNGRRCFSDILVLDTKRQRIDRLAALPSSRCFGAAVAHSGRIYYLGGWDGENQLDEILEIDPENGSATVIGRLPSPRELVTAAVFGNRMYLIGGSDTRGKYLEEILEIDPRSGKITDTARLPSGRTRSAALAFGEQVLVVGGWEGRKLDEVVSVQPVDGTLKVEVFCTLARGESDIAAVSVEGEVYLIGGANEHFQRQIRVLRWMPESNQTSSIKFRSFLFW